MVLGTWHIDDFPAVGSTTDSKDIVLSLNCPITGINIQATVSATAYDAANGIVALSQAADAAKGVGVLLTTDAGTALPLNQLINIGTTTTAGDYNIKWKVRYIKTEDVVTPGTANAIMTVNFEYH